LGIPKRPKFCELNCSYNLSKAHITVVVSDGMSNLKKTALVKVNKFQKQILILSFEPKNEHNYFLNFDLACKMGQTR
jgi:hypothetical protein